MPRKSKEFISAPATPCLCRGTFVVMKTLETLYVMSTPTVEPIVAGKTNAQKLPPSGIKAKRSTLAREPIPDIIRSTRPGST